MSNEAVIVVGMHRSGTSAVMGILRILGVDIGDIGDDPGDQWNEKGYLENKDFFNFEYKLLHAVGGAWDEIVPESKIYESFFAGYQEEYESIVETYNRSPLWGYKAVRGTLFPEILLLVPNLHLVICWRSPGAIAESLAERNDFPREKSLWLWSTYYFRLFRFLSRFDVPYIIVNYDDLVDKPGETVEKIADFLGVDVTEEMIEESKDWMELGLRHFKEKGFGQ